MKILIFFKIIFIMMLIYQCEDKFDWINPLDSNSDVLPESWAPKNLQLERLTITQIKLTWEQEEKRIEGFRIECKIDNGQWQMIVELGMNEKSYTSADLDTTSEYSYRICAFISGKKSNFSNIVWFGLDVTDIDGNVYKTIKIGKQWWMSENLKVTHYRNGDPISYITNNTNWVYAFEGAHCIYNNDANYIDTFGRLYNWYAIKDDRSIAPAGWHIPSDDEFKELELHLGMIQSETNASAQWRGTNEGGKLKTRGTIEKGDGLWNDPNEGATNESGFSALPSGLRHWDDGTFDKIGTMCGFWLSTTNGTYPWRRQLSNEYSSIWRNYCDSGYGYSVRCIKD